MKKRLLVLILAFVLGGMSGCTKAEVDKPTEATGAMVEEEKADYTEKYEEVLIKAYSFIENIEDEIGPEEGFEALWDAAIPLGDEALSELGYAFKDINGDDVSELLIGAFDKEDYAYTNNEIYVVYTLENEEPVILLEGMGRSLYSLKDDSTFFFMSSSGAAVQEFGTLYVTEYGDVVFDDYYFTFPNDFDPSVIEIFCNNTGINYREESEKLDITLDEFWEKQDKAASGSVKVNAASFAELDEEIIEKATLKQKAPNPNLLDGEWILAATEVEGEKLTAEECGFNSEITIANDTAQYFITTEYETKRFEADLEFFEEPLYYDCPNDIWCLKFDTFSSDFDEDEEFYATLIDENTLLLRHLFPFDGALGVSHQTYTRK